MKRYCRWFFCFLMVQSFLLSQENVSYKGGEIIVKFRTPTVFSGVNNQLTSNKAFVNNLISQFNIQSSRPVFPNKEGELGKYFALQFPTFFSVEQVKSAFKGISDIQYVSENALGSFNSPNDSCYSQQWALTKINAANAWKIKSGSSSVIVAAIETGIDLGGNPNTPGYPNPHPDLADNLWNNNGKYGWNVLDTSECPYATIGHGTHVIGIFGAKTNNGIGIAGLAGGGYNSETGIKMMMVKVSDDLTLDETRASNGIVWAADHDAKVINMSFGIQVRFDSDGETITMTPSLQTLEDAISYAYNKGVILVAAMGNNNTYFHSPGGARWYSMYPAGITSKVISVAALNSDDSKRSGDSGSNYAYWCTISAPGTDILSTWPRDLISSGYGYDAGTSMATPFVSGLAALILSYDANKTFSQVKNILTSTADDISAANAGQDWSGKLGAGRINAAKALQSIAPPLAPQSLTLSVENYHPVLNWSANTEYDLNSYKIYRENVSGNGFYFLASVNSSTTTYTDEEVYVWEPDRFCPVASYYVKAVDNTSLESAASNYVSVQYDGFAKKGLPVKPVPQSYFLDQNHPNPFNPTTRISYALPEGGLVYLAVYDNLGREVATVVNEYKEAGYHEASFDASRLASGIYFYKIQSGKFSSVKKMLLLK